MNYNLICIVMCTPICTKNFILVKSGCYSGEPTAAADAGVGAAVAIGVGRWSRGGTPSGTSEEHYWMELPQPSSSWFPCGRGLHHPRS
jgi:hypothetical protein